MVRKYRMDCACAILAGGRSTRMGQDKATLRAGDTTLIQAVFAKIREVFDDVMIISGIHHRLEGVDAPVYGDILPMKGSIVGIASALLYSQKPNVFIVACDLPFLSADAIQYMLEEAKTGEDIIIPKVKLGLEPLHAIYSRFCLSPFLRLIGQGRFKPTAVLPFVSVKTLEDGPMFCVDGRSVFTNINTPRDLELAVAL